MNKLKNDIKVIFLDAGGVLFDTYFKGDERIKYLMTERGYQKSKIDAAIVKAYKFAQEFYNERKMITNWVEEEQFYKEFYGTIAKELGDIELTNELLFCAHYAGHCELFPEVKGVLEALSKKYQLGIISNAMPSMDWIFDRLGIRKYFNSLILSSHVNASKPEEAIYNIGLKNLQTKKNESIFIDDKAENIEGAERVGIRGLNLDREKMNLLELLKEQGLL